MALLCLLLVSAAGVCQEHTSPCSEQCVRRPASVYGIETHTLKCNAVGVVSQQLPNVTCPKPIVGMSAVGPSYRNACTQVALDFTTRVATAKCATHGPCEFEIRVRKADEVCICPPSIHSQPGVTCSHGPCLADQRCVVKKCPVIRKGCRDYHCQPCLDLCDATLSCLPHEQASDVPCTDHQVLHGTCHVVEACCSRTFCRMSTSIDSCATAPCLQGEVCENRPRTCLVPPCPQYTCTPKPEQCCAAMPMCPSTHTRTDVPCTEGALLRGDCMRATACCTERFCLRIGVAQLTSAPPTKAVGAPSNPCLGETCPSGATCVWEQRLCITTPCPQTRCAELCCDAAPQCPAGYQETGSCTPQELASQACVRSEGCCVRKTCRLLPDAHPATPVPARLPAHLRLDLCAVQPCGGGDLCHQTLECSVGPCQGYTCKPPPAMCCEAVPRCAGDEQQSGTPCGLVEVAQGVCRRADLCCSEVFCRSGSEAGGAPAGVPQWAWGVLAVAGVLFVVAVGAVACLVRSRCAAAQHTAHCRTLDNQSLGSTVSAGKA